MARMSDSDPALLDFSDLPPGYWADHIPYGGPDKSFTVYKLPEPLTQGPEVRRDANGNRLLLFMYDYYLFIWPHGWGTISVFHGTIEARQGPMWKLNCTKSWGPETLIEVGRRWAIANDAQFRRK